MRKIHRKVRRCRALSVSVIILSLSIAVSLVHAQLQLRAPNIAVIIIDDVGVDMLSCYDEGTDFPFTPNICNRLTASGTLFRNAWSNPTCSPTRATIQTGRYGFRTTVGFAGNPLPLTETTIAEALNDPLNQHLGYSTAIIGKWHLSGGNFCQPSCTGFGCIGTTVPEDHGYDFYAGTRSNITDFFDWCRTVDDRNSEPDNGTCVENGAVKECRKEAYATIVNVNDAISWSRSQGNGPWFLWLAFNAPHSPWQAPPDDCPNGPCHGQTLPVLEGETCPMGQGRACYKAMIETADTEIGRLLDALPADTVVIFLGDNGSPSQATLPPFNPDHSKFTVYEGGVNVPLIISGPDLGQGGAESGFLVNMTDLFTTILDVAGAVVPPGLLHDSVSLVPLLGGGGDPRDYVFSEHLKASHPSYRKATRNDVYKLLQNPEDIEFYDLADDPFETTDLFDDASPNLVPVEQANFDDLQEFLDFLDGNLTSCPTSSGCIGKPDGSCRRVLPPQCTTGDTLNTACDVNGELFQCPPGQTIRIRNCNCETIVPGAFCINQNQSWFCQ